MVMRMNAEFEGGEIPGQSSETATKRSLSGCFEWVGVFLIAFAVFALVRTFIVSPFMVPSGSMEPTIQIGDNVFAEKVSALFGSEPEIGDIVVFDNPVADSEPDILVKRVVARAGQTVDLIDGSLYVDGVAMDEPYAVGSSYPLDLVAPGVSVSFPYTVPEGCVWVMGDNRENSADSRYFGPVPKDNIIGTVFFRYWPMSRIGPM